MDLGFLRPLGKPAETKVILLSVLPRWSKHFTVGILKGEV